MQNWLGADASSFPTQGMTRGAPQKNPSAEIDAACFRRGELVLQFGVRHPMSEHWVPTGRRCVLRISSRLTVNLPSNARTLGIHKTVS